MGSRFVGGEAPIYVRMNPNPDARTMTNPLPGWIAHYNEVHPHCASGYCSPREFIAKKPRGGDRPLGFDNSQPWRCLWRKRYEYLKVKCEVFEQHWPRPGRL
jgi:hypothetical protein